MSLAGQGSNPLLTKRSREVMLNAEIRRAYRVEKAALAEDVRQVKKAFWAERKESANFRKAVVELGLDPDEIWSLYQQHDKCCEICGTHEDDLKKRLFVDHCHETGAFRGFLCQKCNSGIGLLGDNADGVAKALKYLDK